MEPYRNRSRTSPITGFEIADSFIDVHFRGAGTYRYSYRRPGKTHVDRMKRLARKGEGLTSYINRYVRGHYESAVPHRRFKY